MEPEIEFNPAAFKHGCTEADIRHAFKTFVYENPLENLENKYLVIGFDTTGNRQAGPRKDCRQRITRLRQSGVDAPSSPYQTGPLRPNGLNRLG
jgi:hypothetical protein